MTWSQRLARGLIALGRRLFRNTPIQRFPIVTAIYRRLFAQTHGSSEQLELTYLGASLLVPAADVTVVPSLVAGDYERAEFTALGRLLRPGMTVVDVGANIGVHTVFFASRVAPGGRVFAFEPEPFNFRFLQTNVARNRLTNVECLMEGAGAHAGTLRLHLIAGTVGGHTAAAVAGAAAIDVAVVRLDDAMRERRAHVDLIKIDVEGYEAQVLDGFTDTLQRDRPSLLIEFSPELLRRCGTDPRGLLARLQGLYADILLFDDAGREPSRLDDGVAQSLLRTTTGSRNLLCVAAAAVR